MAKVKAKKHYYFPQADTQYLNDLGRQLVKIYENTNLGSFKTRQRYFKATTQFVRAVFDTYGIKSLNNIQDKHLKWYAEKRMEEGISPSTIKTELSAIRFTHHINPNSKYDLSDGTEFNKSLNIPSTPDGRVDRAWTPAEIDRGIKLANTLQRPEIADIIEFMSVTGCRLDEAATIRKHHLEDALRTGYLHLTNTKGGRPRAVPLDDKAMEVIQHMNSKATRGSYVFVPRDQKVHQLKKSVQDFIGRHRDKIQEAGRGSSAHEVIDGRAGISAHGVRHTYARHEYDKLTLKRTPREAERETSHRLGHGRPEVTRIYLAKRS